MPSWLQSILKINEGELKDKTKVLIINKITNVIEKELTGGRGKSDFSPSYR